MTTKSIDYEPQTIYLDILNHVHSPSLYEEFEAAVESYQSQLKEFNGQVPNL